jgi:Na+/melibiose symporter-like transporter
MAVPEHKQSRGFRNWMFMVRYGVAGAMFLTGCLIAVLDSDHQRGIEVGLMFMGMAIAVLLMNVFFRIGAAGDKDRDTEEEARRFLDEHGYWPDDPRARPRR